MQSELMKYVATLPKVLTKIRIGNKYTYAYNYGVGSSLET